jgi:uncharacterized protein (DUF1015 family)
MIPIKKGKAFIMVEIASFKGITYNKEKIADLDDVMSPPYDIISEKMQEELYEKHAHNFVQLILGKQFKDDNEQNNRYTRAKKLFETWQEKQILHESEKKAIFPYSIQYTVNNKKVVMSGFFVLLKLDPEYNMVKAHEKTLSKPKADRLNLMRACRANLEPIQLLYIDEKDTISKKIGGSNSKTLFCVKGYDGFTHTLSKIDDSSTITDIVNQLKDEVLFIADGHHRYQTACNFAEEMKQKQKNNTSNAPYNYRMVILVNMYDKGLSILPTHRLLRLSNNKIEPILKKLEPYFTIEEKKIHTSLKDYNQTGKIILNDIKSTSNYKFALYCKNKYYVLTLKDNTVMNDFASDKSETWKELDVSVLHKIIIEHCLGITEQTLEDHVKYTRSDAEAIQVVDKELFDMSILMNPTKIEQLRKIAEAGEHMPQKSTYFLPKMLSGLVMYKMDMS